MAQLREVKFCVSNVHIEDLADFRNIDKADKRFLRDFLSFIIFTQNNCIWTLCKLKLWKVTITFPLVPGVVGPNCCVVVLKVQFLSPRLNWEQFFSRNFPSKCIDKVHKDQWSLKMILTVVQQRQQQHIYTR